MNSKVHGNLQFEFGGLSKTAPLPSATWFSCKKYSRQIFSVLAICRCVLHQTRVAIALMHNVRCIEKYQVGMQMY